MLYECKKKFKRDNLRAIKLQKYMVDVDNVSYTHDRTKYYIHIKNENNIFGW